LQFRAFFDANFSQVFLAFLKYLKKRVQNT